MIARGTTRELHVAAAFHKLLHNRPGLHDVRRVNQLRCLYLRTIVSFRRRTSALKRFPWAVLPSRSGPLCKLTRSCNSSPPAPSRKLAGTLHLHSHKEKRARPCSLCARPRFLRFCYSPLGWSRKANTIWYSKVESLSIHAAALARFAISAFAI